MKLIEVAAACRQPDAARLGRQPARHPRGASSRARAAGVSVLCLPELCITGYGCEDAFHRPRRAGRRRWRVLREIAAGDRGHGRRRSACRCCTSNALFNAAVPGRRRPDRRLRGQAVPGRRRASTTSRAGSSRGRRARATTIAAGRRRRTRSATSCFDCGGVRIGFEICEDAWVANRPGADARRGGRRRHPQPQRQPLRLRQVRGPQAVRARGLAGVRRQLRLREPAGQRGRPGDLRRRRADRLGRHAAGRAGRGSRFADVAAHHARWSTSTPTRMAQARTAQLPAATSTSRDDARVALRRSPGRRRRARAARRAARPPGRPART